MIVEYKGEKLYVAWKHDMVPFEAKNAKGQIQKFTGKTYCHITRLDKSMPYFGSAFCSTKDKYSKEYGRKLSLARALGAIPRGERKAFWDAYFARNDGNGTVAQG